MKFITSGFVSHQQPLLIICDWSYYLYYQEEIEEWADICISGWSQTGLVLEFKTEEDRLAFMLRWG